MSNIVLSGFGFFDKPHLILDYIDQNKKTQRKKFEIQNQEFSLFLREERFCIGRFNLQDFSSEPCPDKAQLTTNSDTCASCFKSNSFNPAFYNVSEDRISAKQQKYNASPHNVYLAYFGDGALKVGISHHERTLTRWCEQGARAATVIKKCKNAYDARSLEALISRDLKLQESFKAKQKREFVNYPFMTDDALQNLQRMRIRITKDLNIGIEENDTIFLDKYYLGEKVLNGKINDVSDNDPLFISGTGIGIIGDILIVEQYKKMFMVSIKKFISHEIEVRSEIKTHDVPFEQLSLF